MKKRDQDLKTEEGYSLQFRPRASTTVTVKIPNEVLASLEKIAARRDMSVEALVRFYIGQSLRQDLDETTSESAFEKASGFSR